MLLYGVLVPPPPFDPLLLLFAALLLDAALGGIAPAASALHPVRLIGAAVAWLDRKLNRPSRAERDRAVRGGFVVLMVCGVSAAAGWGVTWLSAAFPYGWIIELLLTAWLLAQRSLFDHVHAVARALSRGGTEAGRQAVAHIVGRDARLLDESGVARAAIESCAENYSDAVVAPTLWYIVFGFPGLLVFKAINTMDSMIGYRSERHRAFGMAAARTDDGANFLPARVAGAFLCVAAVFVPTARPLAGARVMLRDARKHRSVNAGWPEAAAAGALGLALAGPRRYHSEIVDDPWIGAEGRARATAKDIHRALYLYAVGCVVNALLVALLILIRMNWP